MCRCGSVGKGCLTGQVQWPGLAAARELDQGDKRKAHNCPDFFDFQHGEIVMTDLEFLDRAESLLQALEQRCDALNERSDVDIDNQRTGGMVTLTFPHRSQIIVNLQKPLHEVWMAARSGGYHYRWVDGQWRDTKGEAEFFDALSRDASAQAGMALDFRA